MSDDKEHYTIKTGHVGGYTQAGLEQGSEQFNAGYSCYSAAWPLLKEYPGHKFQSGLFGTWMFAENTPPDGKRLYSDIEGGLGWWRDTEYPTETPKFIMGGVALDFIAWANGPGAGKERDWDNPAGHYGVAQLSPWVLWPPDGLNLKQGTSGELFGWAYWPLPLTNEKDTTAGVDVPTGNNSWTLFLNTANFKGPVTFFTPYFWSQVTVDDPSIAGLFLDSKPSKSSRHFSIETQHLPWAQAMGSDGNLYGRLAPTLFPAGRNPDEGMLHRVTSYSKGTLWDGVQAWFDGGEPAYPVITGETAHVHSFNGKGGPGFRIWLDGDANDEKPDVDVAPFMKPAILNPETFGFEWDHDLVTPDGNTPLVTLPQYYRQTTDDEGNNKWVVISVEEVPNETGLTDVSFSRPEERPPLTYVTPAEPDSCWKSPGPVAGPFEAFPGDGSKVTYYWYRFADQPSLLNADLTDAERDELQGRVEKLHRHWTKDRDYLPSPEVGTLAEIDSALIVEPPEGLEVGYVPIVTEQGPA